MTSMPYPLPISAMLLQCCDPSDDEGRHEHLGDETFDPWRDGPPAGLSDDLQADRDHWRAEAMRYKTGLVELHASIRELRAALDASQEVLDRACEWADWRKLWQTITKKARCLAQAIRRRMR